MVTKMGVSIASLFICQFDHVRMCVRVCEIGASVHKHGNASRGVSQKSVLIVIR
jgi:hypothetical protein